MPLRRRVYRHLFTQRLNILEFPSFSFSLSPTAFWSAIYDTIKRGQAWAFAYLWLPLHGPFESRLCEQSTCGLGNMGCLWAIHLRCQWGKWKVGCKGVINYSLGFTLHLLDAKLGTFRKEAGKSWEENLKLTRFRPWNVLTQESREWPDSNVDPASLTWGGVLQIGRGRKDGRNSFPHRLNTLASDPLTGLSASPLHRVAQSQGRRQGSSASGLPRTQFLKRKHKQRLDAYFRQKQVQRDLRPFISHTEWTAWGLCPLKSSINLHRDHHLQMPIFISHYQC